MGVPCVFAYATNWTGGLYVYGDERMTKGIEGFFFQSPRKFKRRTTYVQVTKENLALIFACLAFLLSYQC